jgi:phospholipid/cholesterol/gamma-HCH transport system ATP-binding protein
MIHFDNVCKNFDGKQVLAGVSFDVVEGEILAIVGPSGTGKSVTLKHIVGLLTPDSGTVTVREGARIGYLFQGGALLAWLTVRENVSLPLRETTKLSEDEIARQTDEALKAVGLEESADKYPAEISGGMVKRAGLARAIVRHADAVLYDEPTSGLDPVTAQTIHRLIRRLNAERKLTSVVVTHDLAGACSFADRILMLKEGHVVLAATPEEFLKSDIPAVREYVIASKGEL